jgi:hypothetical protein
VASDLILLSGRGEGGETGGYSRGASAGNNNFDQSVPEPANAGAGPISDDDIPF